MENIIKDDWPIVLTLKNIPVYPIKIYDADGVESRYTFELNRITGECKRFLLNEVGLPFALFDDVLAFETVTIKTPVIVVNAIGATGEAPEFEMDDIINRIERIFYSKTIGFHWQDCYLSHSNCAIKFLIDQIRRLRGVIEERLGNDQVF